MTPKLNTQKVENNIQTMKASEARQIAENKKRTDFRESFDKVINEIKIHSSLGQFETYYFNRLPKDVEEELNRLGYKVTRKGDNRNGEDILIKW